MAQFFDNDLLQTEYYRNLKAAYEDPSNAPFPRPFRSPEILLYALNSIFEHNKEHAHYFTNRIKTQQNQFRDCEAVFTEIIVYSYYLNLLLEGILNSVDRKEQDYDLRIEIKDGIYHFLEIFSIMPEIKVWTREEEIEQGETRAVELHTHSQDYPSSIRYKLLEKIVKRGQMSKPRKNFAVIELNNPIIAGDFTINSSLSNGYKITIDPKNREKIEEGYDWANSVFNEPSLTNLVGIIYFSLGDYGRRKFIYNPNYKVLRSE